MNKPKEAFKDKKFLESPEGRSIRILSEYEKVKSVFEIHKIIDTITFFGSARIKSKEDNNNLADENTECYEQARALAFKFTKWANEYSKDHNRFVIATGGGPGIMEAANRGAFEYVGNGRDMLGGGDSYTQTSELLSKGLICKYAQASVEEDFNMMVYWLFTKPNELKVLAKKYPIIHSKMWMVIDFYQLSIDSRIKF